MIDNLTDDQRNWILVGGAALMMVLLFAIGMVLGTMVTVETSMGGGASGAG